MHQNSAYSPAIECFDPFCRVHEEIPDKRTPQAGGGQHAVGCGGLGGLPLGNHPI